MARSYPRSKTGCPAISMSPSRFASRSRSRRRCTTSTKQFAKLGPTESAPKEHVQEQRQQQAQQQAGDDRKVEMNVATVDGDVPWQFTEEGNPESQAEKQADHEDEASDDDEQLADLG